jgi:hypothetical protein
VKVFAICYPKAIANAAASSMVATVAPAIFIEVVAVILLAVILPVTFNGEITLPLKLNPAAFKLPPVMLPVAEINPPVSRHNLKNCPPSLDVGCHWLQRCQGIVNCAATAG